MAWDVEYTNVFGRWWDELSLEEQASVSRVVGLLELNGPSLTRPYADTLKGSRIMNLKELRVQHEGRPLRILYAFDPRRVGLLLLGGDKTGDNRWYEKAIPLAEQLYEDHIRETEG